MLLWHALLFSLLVMSTLAIPVTFDTSDTSDTEGADKPGWKLVKGNDEKPLSKTAKTTRPDKWLLAD